jgi:RNA polymerase sigma factor (sigma-70 family)
MTAAARFETARPTAQLISDEAVMLDIRDGQTGKLSLLFERHHRALFQFFYRLTGSREQSEDLVQDVFLRILKYRESYQARSSFTAWMYQVARSAQIDSFRKRKPESQWNEDGPEPASKEPAVDERMRKRQEIAMLERALEALPSDKRELLVLSRYQNLKYQEIGEMLGCDANAVKLRVYRALRSLSQIFSEMAGERAS